MDFKEIRTKDRFQKLLGKVLIEKDDMVISIKVHGLDKPETEGICSLLEPYVNEKELNDMKRIFNKAYQKKKLQELRSIS